MPTHEVSSERADNFIARVAIALDEARPEHSYLYDAGTVALAGVNDGEDTRDVAFATLADGARRAYVLSRRPEALVVIDLDQSTPSRLHVRDLISLGFGPSRMTLAEIPVGLDMAITATETVAFVSCFDSGDVWAVLPERGRVVSIARNLSGPYAIEVDTWFDTAAGEWQGRMYLTDFTSSVVRVVDLRNVMLCLDGMVPDNDGRSCEPEQLPSIGRPRPVRELI
jgi:hypothetical protein